MEIGGYVPHNLGICTILRLRCAISESRNCVPILRLRDTSAQSRDRTISIENPGHHFSFHHIYKGKERT